MKPPTVHDDRAPGGGAKLPLTDPEDIDQRSVLFAEPPDSGGGREHLSKVNKRSHSKYKTTTGLGSAQTEKTSVAREGLSDTFTAGSGACAHPSDPSSSVLAPAAANTADPSSAPGAPAVETLQSTLLRLKTRNLPAGPLPKMDEVIARFMNISPKQWQLLNSTIDELNGRFKQGALHWLLLRWLVAAHPEQFFPPPFNSYQQLLQQVSQKDAEVEEARREATKWRRTCVRLEAERERWKLQLQQMEEEVSGLYTDLAARQDLVVTGDGRLKQQSTQQCANVSGGTPAMLLPPGETLWDRAQPPQQPHNEVKHPGHQQQRRNQLQQHHPQQQHIHRQEGKQQPYPEGLQEHSDHKEKLHGALLLPQLAHPVSIAESAFSCEQPAGVDEAHREGEKKDADSSNLPCATKTTKTKTTVTTTTKSSTTSAHSVSVTKDTDAALPSSMQASNQQVRDIPTPKTNRHLCDTGGAGGEVSLASVLACVQNLLRRLTAENTDSPAVSPSGTPSPREGEGPELNACISPGSRDLKKHQGRKVHRKNVELWYLQYEQQNGPSAGPDEEKKKKKLQLHQDKRDRDKKKKHQEQGKHQHPQERDQPASKEEAEQQEEGRKLQHDVPLSVEGRQSDDGLMALSAPSSEAEVAGGRGPDSQRGGRQTSNPKSQQHQVNLRSFSPFSTSKPSAPISSNANVLIMQAPPASAVPEQFSAAGDLLHVNQHTYPVQAYIRRFLALYRGGQHIPETIATSIFVDNLRPELKRYVQVRQPASLMQAILLARQAERTAAPFAVTRSGAKIHTEAFSAHDSCGETAHARTPVSHAMKRDDGVEENEAADSKERQLNDCRLSAAASGVDSQRPLTGNHRYMTFLHKNEPVTCTENVTHQAQQSQHGTPQANQSRLQQQQQEQRLVPDVDAVDGDIWHSSDDTIQSNAGDFETPTARMDQQQQPSEDEEQRQKLATSQEKTVVIPRPRKAKQNATERTHVVRRLLTGSNHCALPRDS